MDESPAVPEKENGRAAMSWRSMLAAWLVPLLLQALILGVIACNDPSPAMATRGAWREQ